MAYLTFGKKFQEDNEKGRKQRACANADERVKDHSKMIDLDKKEQRMMQQDQREYITQECAKSLRPYPNLGSFCTSGFHLVMDKERSQVSNEDSGGSMHPECVGKHVYGETNAESNEQKIHSVNVRRKQKHARNVNEAECIIEQYDIPHEEDLQEKIQQDHQGILYSFS